MFKITAPSFFCIALCYCAIDARILNVPREYTTIASGIQAAKNGDTVLIAPGSYNEGINFKGKKITVSSNFLLTGDTSTIKSTVVFDIVSPQITESSRDFSQDTPRQPYSVEFSGAEDKSSILSGIEIRDMPVIIEDSAHPIITNVRIVGSSETARASSMSINSAETMSFSGIHFINSFISFFSGLGTSQLSGCTFINSTISRSPGRSSIAISNNDFINSAISSGGTGRASDSLRITGNRFNESYISLSGTGDFCITTEITGNTFAGSDTAERSRSSIDLGGTGNLRIDATIKNNRFNRTGIMLGGTGEAIIKTAISKNTFNGTGLYGTGILCGGTGLCAVTAAVDSNRFYGANFSISGTGAFLVNANLVCNIFYGYAGSAIELDRICMANYTCNLANNTIIGNQIGIQYDNVGGLNILNCIISNNGTDLMNVHAEQIAYSLWNTGLAHSAGSNIAGDPMLTDTANLDFSLRKGSPCIGTGTYSPFADIFNFSRQNDMGAIAYQSSTIALKEKSAFETISTGPALMGTLLHTGSIPSSGYEIRVFDLRGRLVKRTIGKSSGATTIDLKCFSLPAASYVVRVTRGPGITSLRYVQR